MGLNLNSLIENKMNSFLKNATEDDIYNLLQKIGVMDENHELIGPYKNIITKIKEDYELKPHKITPCEKHDYKFTLEYDNKKVCWCSKCGTISVTDLSDSKYLEFVPENLKKFDKFEKI